jgi:predicted transcriptional regulator
MKTKYKNKKEPAFSIVLALGGVRSTARLLEISPSAVSRWLSPVSKNGTGGMIPHWHWKAILRHAALTNIKIKISDLTVLR